MVEGPRKSHSCKVCERVHLCPESPWWGEHRSRYRFARPHANSARILDIACGTGFGVAMLEEAGAGLVVGVDLSPATVREAGRDHAGPGRSFVAANGVRLPFATATFELIVSFENAGTHLCFRPFLGGTEEGTETGWGTAAFHSEQGLHGDERSGVR